MVDSGFHRQGKKGQVISQDGAAGVYAAKRTLPWWIGDAKAVTLGCALWQVARPHHYVKNVFVGLPLFFGHKLNDPRAASATLFAFLAFCLAASAVYVLNDIRDVDEDRCHPRKQFRPLARGVLKVSHAAFLMAVLALLSLAISGMLLPSTFVGVIFAYLLLNVAYSLYLKQFAIVDLVCISVGFVLRVVGGGVAADVAVSRWIVVMTFLLAVFLALGKRRDDLLLAAAGNGGRKSLNGYNMEFVSLAMIALTSVIIVSYILYTISPEIIGKHGTQNLYLSGFWVIVGFIRYLQVVVVLKKSGSPTRLLLEDHGLKCIIGGWLITVYALIYGIGF